MKEVPILIERDEQYEGGSWIIFCSDECCQIYQDIEQPTQFVDDTTDASSLYLVFCALCGRLITGDEDNA